MERRAVNFSDDEISALISSIEDYKNIIECKKTDSVMWKDKEQAWEKIAKYLNDLGFPQRSTKQLRDKWGNLKKETKRKYGEEKIEKFKTGGGPTKIIDISESDERIKSMIGVAVTGESNCWDSDNFEKKNAGMSVRSDPNIDSDISQKSSWTSWNPAALKLPKTQELIVPHPLALKVPEAQNVIVPDLLEKQGFRAVKDKFIVIDRFKLRSQEEKNSMFNIGNKKQPVIFPVEAANTCSKTKGLEKTLEHTPTRTAIKKKTILTADCRIKINTLSDAKLELVKVQKECLSNEMKIKEEEHKLYMEQSKEEHAIKMRKHKIELDILELELLKKKSNSFEHF